MIITQQELVRLTECLKNIHKIEKENTSALKCLVMKKGKISALFAKNTFEKHVNLLFLEEKDKTIMSLIKILILSCTIRLYIVEDNIFAGKNVILLIALKLMLNKEFKFLRNVNMLDSKLWKEKSYHLWFMQILKVF